MTTERFPRPSDAHCDYELPKRHSDAPPSSNGQSGSDSSSPRSRPRPRFQSKIKNQKSKIPRVGREEAFAKQVHAESQPAASPALRP